MEAYLNLWTDRLEPSTSFVDAEYFEQHSSTFKIINGTFRNVLLGESSDEDSKDETHPYNTRNNGKRKTVSPVKSRVQMNQHKQSEKQCGKPGFVPCFVDERKMKYPKFSVLDENQQALVVELMEKYKNSCPKFPTPVEKEELQQLEELLNCITNERFAFDNFTKTHCGVNHDRYTFIKPEVKKYVDELWKHKILQMSRYPTSYESQTLLPIIYPASKNRIMLCMKQVLLQMGTAPVVHIPALKSSLHVVTSYAKMCALHPPDKSVSNGGSASSFNMPVSQDQNAERLAKAYNVDVVISLSGLKRIMNNLPPFSKEWDLPISVKEYTKEEQGRSTKAKVVYIDKALAPSHLTTVERNSWFYKTSVKNVFCRKRNYKNISNEDCKKCPLVSSPSQQVKIKTKSTSLKSCDTNVDTKLNVRSNASIKSTDDLNEENAFNFETTLSSEKYAKTNIQEPCTESKKKRKMLEYDKEHQDSDDDRLVMDCSDTEVFCKKKHSQEEDNNSFYGMSENEDAYLNSKKHSTEKYEQSSNIRDSNEDSEDSMVIDWDISDKSCGQKILSEAITEGTLHQQVSSELNDSNGNADNGEITSFQDLEHPIDNSVLQEGNAQKQAAFIQDTKETGKRSNIEENEDKNLLEDKLSTLPPGKNLSYRLWELKLENSMESQRNNFIKGEHPRQSLTILVRTKVDGYEDDRVHGSAEEVHTVRIIPKLEYQCEFGAECLTQDELFTQWAITFFNPETKLIRVRLDPIRSEVMMFENLSSQEAMQQLGTNSKDFISTLYSILQGLIGLSPGNYLLSHNKKMGTFATLRRAEPQGRYNLQSVYSFDCSAAPSYEYYPWNPIDRNIITPFHRVYNRVPATFPPISQTVKARRKANKKKKKKGNKSAKACE